MLLFRVESESETILVEQVVEESPVVTGLQTLSTKVLNKTDPTKKGEGLRDAGVGSR